MHKRTKALSISKDVRERVNERDNRLCVICGKVGSPNAHYIARSHGGLGVEQNIVTLCLECHTRYDNSVDRELLGNRIKKYLKSQYEDWNENNLTYKKWSDTNESKT